MYRAAITRLPRTAPRAVRTFATQIPPTAPPPTRPAGQQTSPPLPPPHVEKSGGGGNGLLIGAVLLAAAGGGYYYFTQTGDGQKKVGEAKVKGEELKQKAGEKKVSPRSSRPYAHPCCWLRFVIMIR